MKLIMSKHEFLQLRKIISNIDNPSIIEEFNRIVTNQNPHIEAATTSETISLNVSDELSKKIGDVLITHSKSLGKNLNISLANLPKIITGFKKLFGEKGDEPMLLSFLNAILNRTQKEKLTEIEIIENKELTKELIEDKSVE